MNKAQFLKRLSSALKGAPRGEIAKSVQYYSEILDDRVEEGLSEDDAVQSLGDVEAIAKQILSELPAGSIRQGPRAITVVLLILGFPVWSSILAALAAVVLALYAVVWAVCLALWCVELSLSAASGISLVGAGRWFLSGDVSYALIALGAGFVLAGASILGIHGMVPLTKQFGRFSAWSSQRIVRFFAGKRRKAV
jgi:uncharacterized membrane protein